MTTSRDEEPTEALLLTPGPLTTTRATKCVMLRDWGSRDHDFIELTARVRRRLTAIVGGRAGSKTCVPIQGSGTFAVEAALQTLIPRDGKLLILVNGAYGRRMAEICRVIGRAYEVLEWPENQPVDGRQVAAALEADRSITDVAVVHVETTSGLLNPLANVAALVAGAGRRLHIDAMSSFGAVGIDAASVPFTSLFASSNKCLEGVPGIGFVIADVAALERAKGNAVSLALDLEAQGRGFEANGQWRFTPPTHVLAALDAALDQLDAEGGVPGRFGRYSRNCAVLCAGMRELGFTPWLEEGLQAPIIVTFRIPDGGWFRFGDFYDSLHRRGIVIYPGKLTVMDSFRIGCIGAIGEAEMRRALGVIAETIQAMGGSRKP
jgi:2-aminoethylphosphonate-pyruvate transaminase